MQMTLFAVFVSSIWFALGAMFLLRVPAVIAALRRFRNASFFFRIAAFAVLVAAVAVGGSKDGGGQRTIGGFTGETPPDRDAGGSTSSVERLCFTDFSVSSNSVSFAASWPDGETIPDSILDLYEAPALEGPWEVATSFAAVSSPVALSHSVSTNESAGFFRLGTRIDSDGDGLPDAFELLVSLSSSNSPDSDFDGLDDSCEWSLGTNPSAADTDNDGCSDLEETLAGTNPLVPGAAMSNSVRHCRDMDVRLTSSFPGLAPDLSATTWTPAANPAVVCVSN